MVLKGYCIYIWIIILLFNIYMGYYVILETVDCLKCIV